MGKFLKPSWLERYTDIYRESGWRGVMKTGGIKLIIAFFLFYLIRDTVIYVLPFYFGVQFLRSCG